jgi:hypothetical protein
MKIGDVDVLNSILTLESDVKVLQQMLIFILEKNPSIHRPSVEDVHRFRQGAVEQLKLKYPHMDIQKKHG